MTARHVASAVITAALVGLVLTVLTALADPALADHASRGPVCQKTCADGWRGVLCEISRALAACRITR